MRYYADYSVQCINFHFVLFDDKAAVFFIIDIVTDVSKSSFRTVGVVPFTVDSIRYMCTHTHTHKCTCKVHSMLLSYCYRILCRYPERALREVIMVRCSHFSVCFTAFTCDVHVMYMYTCIILTTINSQSCVFL